MIIELLYVTLTAGAVVSGVYIASRRLSIDGILRAMSRWCAWLSLHLFAMAEARSAAREAYRRAYGETVSANSQRVSKLDLIELKLTDEWGMH